MNEFFRTRMGSEFFTQSIPKLIKAIERVADALTNPTKEEKPKSETPELNVALGMGLVMRAMSKEGEYPGYFIDVLIDGEEYPLAAVELEPEFEEGAGRRFSVAVWDSTKTESPAEIIKSKYTVPVSVFKE